MIGYDDILLARLPFVNLTTIASRIDEMATLACEMMVDLIRTGGVSAPPIMLEPELRVRGTCGART